MIDTYARWQDKLQQLNDENIGGGPTHEMNSIREFRKFICAEVDALRAKVNRLEGAGDEA